MRRPGGLSDAEWASLQAYDARRRATIEAIMKRMGADFGVREALMAAYDAGNERKRRLLVPPEQKTARD